MILILIALMLFGIYSTLSLLNYKFSLLNLYFIINTTIFIIPFVFYAFFGMIHPSHYYKFSNNFEYSNVIINVISIIILFDFVTLLSFYFFSKKQKSLNFLELKISNTSLNENILKIFILLFTIILFSDLLLFFSENFFMNKDFLECNKHLVFVYEVNQWINQHSIYKNSIQIIKNISNFKYFLLISLLLLQKLNSNKRIRILLIIICTYCILYALLSGSKFNLIIIAIIFFILNFDELKQFKNLIKVSLLSFLSLFLFPVIGSLRTLYNKQFNGTECLVTLKKNETVITEIIQNIKYNNVFFDRNIYFETIYQKAIFINKPVEILMSRLNYLDITSRAYNYRIYNNIKNNFEFYLDNLYGLVPRILYPNKKVINNHSDELAVKLGTLLEPINAVGLRPIGEGFYYIGFYYIFIAIFLGFLFSLAKKIIDKNSILLSTISIYLIIIVLKRDSFHALVPGMVHEIIAFVIYLFLIKITIDLKFKKK